MQTFALPRLAAGRARPKSFSKKNFFLSNNKINDSAYISRNALNINTRILQILQIITLNTMSKFEIILTILLL